MMNFVERLGDALAVVRAAVGRSAQCGPITIYGNPEFIRRSMAALCHLEEKRPALFEQVCQEIEDLSPGPRTTVLRGLGPAWCLINRRDAEQSAPEYAVTIIRLVCGAQAGEALLETKERWKADAEGFGDAMQRDQPDTARTAALQALNMLDAQLCQLRQPLLRHPPPPP
jgi:hypothetical protein